MKKIIFANTYQNLSRQLESAVQKLGVEASTIQPVDFLLDLGNGFDIKPKIFDKNNVPLDIDENTMVFTTARKPNKTFSVLFLHLCEVMGAKVPNPSFKEMDRSTSKHLQYIRLVGGGFRIPRTVLLLPNNLDTYKNFISQEFPGSFVAKGFGSCGKTVWKTNSIEDLKNILKDVDDKSKEVLVIQEFVENSHEEYRVVHVMGEPLITVVRGSDDFLNNHAQGGNVTTTVLKKHEIEMSTKAALISGLDYVGVDFMKDKDGNMIFVELQTGPDIEVSQIADENAINKIAVKLVENLG